MEAYTALLGHKFAVLLHYRAMRRQAKSDRAITLEDYKKSIEKYLTKYPIIAKRMAAAQIPVSKVAQRFFKEK